MRIISAAPSNTEILYALGLGDDVVAVTRFCDYPAEAKEKPKIGGWLDVKYDKLKEFNADLVVTSTFVQDKVKGELERRGIKVLHVDPITLSDVYDTIRFIGKTVNKSERAEEIVKEMQEGFLQVQEKRGIVTTRTRVYCEEWNEPPSASGNWVPELIEIAGGNSFAPVGLHSMPIEEQKLFAWQPDMIVLSWCGFGTNSRIDWVKTRVGWDKLLAVRENKIYQFDESLLNRPSPRLVQGAEMLAKLLHPEKFK